LRSFGEGGPDDQKQRNLTELLGAQSIASNLSDSQGSVAKTVTTDRANGAKFKELGPIGKFGNSWLAKGFSQLSWYCFVDPMRYAGRDGAAADGVPLRASLEGPKNRIVQV
jgi:hypothetical protein